MNCDEASGLLTAHADGELGLPNASELEDHLNSCANCRRQLASMTELRSALRMHADYHVAPGGLAARIRAALPGQETRTAGAQSSPGPDEKPRGSGARGSGQWGRLQWGAAFATAVAVLWSVALYLAWPGAGEALEKELVASHARALMADHALDVASSDQHTVKPWFNGKLDFSPDVTDLASQGFPLAGGRLDYLAQRPVAALVYRHRQHFINLYVWPVEKKDASMNSTRQGFNLLHWTHNSMSYWAVSDLNAVELAEFRDTLLQKGQ